MCDTLLAFIRWRQYVESYASDIQAQKRRWNKFERVSAPMTVCPVYSDAILGGELKAAVVLFVYSL